MARRARKSKKRSKGTLITKEQAFGSVVVILAGIAAVVGMGAYAFDQQQSSGSLAGYASVNQLDVSCFTTCIKNACGYSQYVSSCLDDSVGQCRAICNL